MKQEADNGRKTNFALLIDADNIASTNADSLMKLDSILSAISSYGRITIKRIYGDFTKDHLKSWNEKIIRHAIKPIQKFEYTKGKNSADIALVIDAMDLLHNNQDLEGFCIVSRDGDFAGLATRIREAGKIVIGIGTRENQTTNFFQKSCDEYLFLENLMQLDKSAENQPDKISEEDLKILIDAYDAVETDQGFAFLSKIPLYLNNKDSSFNAKNLGFKNYSSLFKSLDKHFAFEILEDNSTIIIRKIK